MNSLSSGNYNIIQENHIKESIKIVLDNNQYHGYSSPKGIKELRTRISLFLKELWNYEVNPSNMLITSGSQQSIHLVIEAFLNSNDGILVEQPTYFGAIKVFQNKKLNMTGIPIYEDGIDLVELEKMILEKKPKCIYVVPTFNNPTGYAWSKENRIRFLEIINRYHILVIEDDPYSLIHFSNQEYPTLYQLNKGKNVIYLGTFSKYISPSINVGYILADKKSICALYQYKEAYDLCTSLFHQQVVLTYLEHFDLIQEIKNRIPKYQKYLIRMQKHIKEKFGNQVDFTIPKGGIFFLVHFKNGKVPITLEDHQSYFINQLNQEYTRINICSLLDKERDK